MSDINVGYTLINQLKEVVGELESIKLELKKLTNKSPEPDINVFTNSGLPEDGPLGNIWHGHGRTLGTPQAFWDNLHKPDIDPPIQVAGKTFSYKAELLTAASAAREAGDEVLTRLLSRCFDEIFDKSQGIDQYFKMCDSRSGLHKRYFELLNGEPNPLALRNYGAKLRE